MAHILPWTLCCMGALQVIYILRRSLGSSISRIDSLGTWEEVKSLLTRLSRRDMMVASSRTGSGREVEETRRIVSGLSFGVQLLMELDLVSERKRIAWHF